MKDIFTHIKEIVTSRYNSLAQEFLNLDYAGISVISKEDFRELCNRNFMLLTDEQVRSMLFVFYRHECKANMYYKAHIF